MGGSETRFNYLGQDMAVKDIPKKVVWFPFMRAVYFPGEAVWFVSFYGNVSSNSLSRKANLCPTFFIETDDAGGVHLTKTMSISSTPIRHPISNFQKIELIINLTAKTKELKSHAEGGC